MMTGVEDYSQVVAEPPLGDGTVLAYTETRFLLGL